MEYICLCIAKRMPFNVHLTIGIKWYKTVEDVYEDWNDLVNEKGWIPIDDPLPYCQHDAFLPIRVKGRDIGEPQWGKLEILENGKWKEYIPDQ